MINNLTTKTIDTTHLLTCEACGMIHLPACEACGMTTMQPMRVRRTPSYTTPIYGYDQTAIVLPSPLQHDTIHTYDDTYLTFTHNTDNTIESTQINTSRTTSTTPQTPLYASTTSSAQNYYGYRYYSSTMGRWINRDPIGKDGREKSRLYLFCGNDVFNVLDNLGLEPINLKWMVSNSGSGFYYCHGTVCRVCPQDQEKTHLCPKCKGGGGCGWFSSPSMAKIYEMANEFLPKCTENCRDVFISHLRCEYSER